MSTCTASASDSSRRLRSSSPVSCSAAVIRWRSQPVSAVAPSRSAAAAACSSWPTWRRSVRRRSPSSSESSRPGRPSTSVIRSSSAATPRTRSTRAHSCRRRWTSSHASSPAPATCSASQPRNGVSAAARARAGALGRSIASSSRSQSRAGSEPNTLPAPLITAGISTASSASRTSAAWRCVRTSTATCPGRTGVLPEHRAVLRPALDPRAGGEQPDEVAGEVARDVAARGVVARVAVAGLLDRRVVAVHDAHPQRLGMRGAEQPRLAVGAGGAHGAVGDPLVAEPRVGEQRVVGLQQALVAAPVDLERGARRRRSARPPGTRRRRRRGTRRSPAWGRR